MAEQPLTVGTAGHVDPGKTTLVRALTGRDTDRLAEERRRGLSIELGFAELDLGARRLSLVDVPGHEHFVRTMIAGASGIDMFLLLVAADDGPMPQTHEHLAVLPALGVERGVVALSKVDLVDAETRRLAAAEAAALAPGLPLVEVSAKSGEVSTSSAGPLRPSPSRRNRAGVRPFSPIRAAKDERREPSAPGKASGTEAGLGSDQAPAADEPVLHVDWAFSVAARDASRCGVLSRPNSACYSASLRPCLVRSGARQPTYAGFARSLPADQGCASP